MTTAIRFDFGSESQGKRLVKAFHGEELLTQERFDVFQAWQATPFLEKVTDRIPATANYDSPADALAFVRGDFEEAIKSIADGRAAEISQPVLRPMSEVQSREIAWLWPNRFALGKLSLLIGEPGNGKSYWSLDTAARISIESPWPDGSGKAPLGSVLLMGVEDDLADTVKPRLEAAGADVAKIVALTGVANKDDEGQYERTVDLRRDIPILEAALQQIPDTRAIIIDPISAFMGKTDSHVNAEVRETLAPLAQLAERYAVAVIAITHLRKGESSALHRAMGSVAFTAAARSVWAIAKDKRDPEGRRRLLLPVKSNISEDKGGLAFTLTKRHGLESAMPHIEYEPDPITDTNADDQLSTEPRKRGAESESLSEAIDFLQNALADGPRPTKQIESEARDGYGISRRTMERARKQMGVESFRDTIPGPWLLRLSATPPSTPPQDPIHKQCGGLGGVGNSSGKTSETTLHKSNTASLFVRGDVGTNGHDIDAANRELSQAGEGSGDETFDWMKQNWKGF